MNEQYFFSGMRLFIDKENTLFLEGGSGKIYNVEKYDYSMFLLPLLEVPYDDFFSQKNMKISERLRIIDLLKFSIENKMEYWAELALDWIETGGLYPVLTEWGKTIETKWMSQKLKHRFWKTLRIRSYP